MINRGQYDALPHSFNGQRGFDCSRCSNVCPNCDLFEDTGIFFYFFAENITQTLYFRTVSFGCGSSVGIDILISSGFKPGIFNCFL